MKINCPFKDCEIFLVVLTMIQDHMKGVFMRNRLAHWPCRRKCPIHPSCPEMMSTIFITVKPGVWSTSIHNPHIHRR